MISLWKRKVNKINFFYIFSLRVTTFTLANIPPNVMTNIFIYIYIYILKYLNLDHFLIYLTDSVWHGSKPTQLDMETSWLGSTSV